MGATTSTRSSVSPAMRLKPSPRIRMQPLFSSKQLASILEQMLEVATSEAESLAGQVGGGPIDMARQMIRLAGLTEDEVPIRITGLRPGEKLHEELLRDAEHSAPSGVAGILRALGAASDSAIRMGAVVEIVHAATLVHDDVIDEAETRRGRPSSRSRHVARASNQRSPSLPTPPSPSLTVTETV